MSWGKVTGAMAGAAVLVGLLGGVAWSAALVGEDFERGAGEKARATVKETPHGPGWRAEQGGDRPDTGDYLRYPAAGLINPAAGTVELDLVRDNDDAMESLFGLLDGQGHTLLTLRIWWQDWRPKPQQGAFLEALTSPQVSPWHRTVRESHGQRAQWQEQMLALPAVGRGGRLHVAMTWGPGPGQCKLWANGAALATDPVDAERIREIVQRTEWLVVGSELDRGMSFGQLRSVVKAFTVYDEVVSVSALYANPEAFRPRAVAPPEIASVEHDAGRVAGFSGKLVAGNTLGVTVRGEPGAVGSFDVAHYPDLGGALEVDWSGWGVYLEEKTFYEPGEVNLREVKEYAVYRAGAPFDALAPGMEPEARLGVGVQRHRFELLAVDEPCYVAVVAEMKDGTFRPVIAPRAGLALQESEPGVYTGSWTVGYADRYARAAVVGRLERDGVSAEARAAEPLAADPALRLSVGTEPSELKADERSSSEVTVTVTDANGDPVSGHTVKFLLATTSQYTGVVGGGAFAEQVGGAIAADAWGQTDLFGRVRARYVAGFAAKTAVIVARDMASNDTGAGWVKTYIQSTAQLELEPTEVAAAAEGYEIAVTSSDAWLTADGRSQARITAKVTLNGAPVEGHQVGFEVSGGTGTVRVVKGTTGADGLARAVYTAGTKIGVVLVTATDFTVGISGSVAIELRSDAPAKLRIRIEPEKLPADGHSRADLLVQVTDINDNPNDSVEVEYRIAEGGGWLAEERGTTDRRGESANVYTAGRSPGRVSLEITVRSTVPTEEELAAARALAVAVTDFDFF